MSRETVNGDAYGEGWLVEFELTNIGELDNLLDAAAYQDLTSRV